MWFDETAMRISRDTRFAVLFLLPALVFMGGIFAVPLGIVVRQSVTDENGLFTWNGYRELLSSPLFFRVLETTFEISLVATLITLVIAYPIAYHLAHQPPRWRAFLFALVLLPFWTSILVKSFAFMVIFGDSGFIASIIKSVLGPEYTPRLMFNRTGVIIGLVHFFIPFMTFPILSSLVLRDPDLPKAAQIMGAGSWRIFWRVTFPLSLPGVMAGCLLTFVLSLGFFVTPALLGGRKDVMMANLVDLYMRQTFNWTAAAAVSVVLLMVSVLFIVLLSRLPGGRAVLGRAE
jgi:ABC-type spermidine/putrescine transport system permease subunit I